MRLDHAEPSEEAFLAAGESVVDNCEMVIAVWDGAGARTRRNCGHRPLRA